jgi:hypothetical protein
VQRGARRLRTRRDRQPAATPARIQAAYYVVTGVFPIVAPRLFEAVTGPKRELWLVKMVGLLTVAVGTALAAPGAANEEVGRRLGVGAAASYLAVDVWYAGVRRRIRPIYLADAVAEAILIIGWLRAARGGQATVTRRA